MRTPNPFGDADCIRSQQMKRLIPVVLGTAAGTLLGAASFFAVDGLMPAEASRRVVDVTDAETKAFCNANPDQCTTRFRWDITVGWLLVLLIGPLAWKYLNQTLLAGVHSSYAEAKAVKPHQRP